MGIGIASLSFNSQSDEKALEKSRKSEKKKKKKKKKKRQDNTK